MKILLGDLSPELGGHWLDCYVFEACYLYANPLPTSKSCLTWNIALSSQLEHCAETLSKFTQSGGRSTRMTSTVSTFEVETVNPLETIPGQRPASLSKPQWKKLRGKAHQIREKHGADIELIKQMTESQRRAAIQKVRNHISARYPSLSISLLSLFPSSSIMNTTTLF